MNITANANIIEEILKMPSAYMIVNEVQKKLKEEAQKRKQFYETITEQEKAEFINGEVIVHSPVILAHNKVCGNLYSILNSYVVEKSIGLVGIEKLMIQLTRNDYEPDICYFNQQTADTFTEDQMFFPAPDMIVEVLSKSTEKRDRGIKYDDYEKHDVQEYWIVDPKKQTVEQYVLEDGTYKLMLKSNSGNVTLQVIENLTIPVRAIFDSTLAHQLVKSM